MFAASGPARRSWSGDQASTAGPASIENINPKLYHVGTIEWHQIGENWLAIWSVKTNVGLNESEGPHMNNQIAFYHAHAFNPATVQFDIWMGTAPLETIKKYGLGADLSWPLYGDMSQCVDGWRFKAPANPF
jgi:hypothetical protein